MASTYNASTRGFDSTSVLHSDERTASSVLESGEDAPPFQPLPAVIEIFAGVQNDADKSQFVQHVEVLKAQHFAASNANRPEIIEEFNKSFFNCLLLILAEKAAGRDRLLEFVALYVKTISQSVEGNYNLEALEQFNKRLFEILKQGITGKKVAVRRGCAYMLNEILTSDASIIFTRLETKEITEMLFERIYDTDARVRVRVISALREAEKGYKKSIAKGLSYLAERDPSPAVRARSLQLLVGEVTVDVNPDISAISVMNDPKDFLNLVVSRTRDPGIAVRTQAYKILLDKRITLHDVAETQDIAEDGTRIQPTVRDQQLERVLRGLVDNSPQVRDATWDLVVHWIRSLNSNLFLLVDALDVLPTLDDTSNFLHASPAKEKLMATIHEKIPGKHGSDYISAFTREVTPETAFLIRTYSQFLKGNGTRGTELRDSDLPPAGDLVELLNEIWQDLAELQQESYLRDENRRLEILEKDYTFGQLLQTLSHYDIEDQTTISNLRDAVENMLQDPTIVSRQVPLLMKLLRSICPDDAHFLNQSIELINGQRTGVAGINDVLRQLDGQLDLIEGTLSNVSFVYDETQYETMKGPVLRCFDLSANDVRQSATRICGLLALASLTHHNELLTTLVENYRDAEKDAAREAKQIQDEWKELERKIGEAKRSKVRNLRKEQEALLEMRPGWTTWGERTEIIFALTDIIGHFANQHSGALKILRDGIENSDDRELRAVCIYSATKLIFSNCWHETGTVKMLIHTYWQEYGSPREPISLHGTRVLPSAVDSIEYFFSVFCLEPKSLLKVASDFVEIMCGYYDFGPAFSEARARRVMEAAPEEVELGKVLKSRVAVEKAEQRQREREMGSQSLQQDQLRGHEPPLKKRRLSQQPGSLALDAQDDDADDADLEVQIREVVEKTKRTLSNFIRWTDPNLLVQGQAGALPVQAFIYNKLLEQLVALMPQYKRDLEFENDIKPYKKKLRDVGSLRPAHSYAVMLFDLLKLLNLATDIPMSKFVQIRENLTAIVDTNEYPKLRIEYCKRILAYVDEKIEGKQSPSMHGAPLLEELGADIPAAAAVSASTPVEVEGIDEPEIDEVDEVEPSSVAATSQLETRID